MGKRVTDYPHTISFRLTDEAWNGIQKEIAGRELTAHEWCRKAALDRLNNSYGLSKIERLLREHFVRAQYLVTQGFQLLADDKLTGDNWKKLRVIATERASEITDKALALRAQGVMNALDKERSERKCLKVWCHDTSSISKPCYML
jgi:hypothetical protein